MELVIRGLVLSSVHKINFRNSKYQHLFERNYDVLEKYALYAFLISVLQKLTSFIIKMLILLILL
jgi:hypothetical protein